MPPTSVRSGLEFSQIGGARTVDGPLAWPKVTWTTWDDGGVADNASDTATGPDRDPTVGPSGDDTDKAAQVEAPPQTSGQETSGRQESDQQGTGQQNAGQQAIGQQGTGQQGTGRGRSALRDVVMSMIVLVVIILVLAAVSHSCSFSPGGPSVDSGSLPTVDVSAELQAAAAQVHFPLREPTLPKDWRPNSNSVDPLGPKGVDQAVRIGVLTDVDHYLQVSQSDASVADLVRSAAGLGDQASITPTGDEVVNGTKWTVYPGIRSESSWATDLGNERLFITGNGTVAEFRALAAAILTGHRVTAAGGP